MPFLATFHMKCTSETLTFTVITALPKKTVNRTL